MCNLKVHALCSDRFFEVSPNEVENAELMVEDVASQVLLHLFGEGMVDDVAIRFSSNLCMGLQQCSILIHAQCACRYFTQLPHTKEHMKLAVQNSFGSLLKELFGRVNVDDVTLSPSLESFGNDATLPCCAPS